MSLPEPTPDQQKGNGIARRGRRSSKRTLFLVRNLEPLSLACRQRRRRRRSASLDANVDNEDGEEDEEDEDGKIDISMQMRTGIQTTGSGQVSLW